MTESRSLTGWRLSAARVLALAAIIGLSIYLFSIRERAAELAVYGYPGIFLLSVLANATLVLPMPGVAITFAGGAIFHPLLVGLAAGAGATIGELTGYAAGASGKGALENTRLYRFLERLTARYGSLVIFFLALFPNPVFDLAGAAAGAVRMDLRRYLFWSWLGKTLKMLIFAYAGASSALWLLELFSL